MNLKASLVYPVRLMINFNCELDGIITMQAEVVLLIPHTHEETDGSLSSWPV